MAIFFPATAVRLELVRVAPGNSGVNTDLGRLGNARTTVAPLATATD